MGLFRRASKARTCIGVQEALHNLGILRRIDHSYVHVRHGYLVMAGAPCRGGNHMSPVQKQCREAVNKEFIDSSMKEQFPCWLKVRPRERHVGVRVQRL